MATEKRLVYAREVEEIFNFVEHECSDSYEAFKVAINKATTVEAVPAVHGQWRQARYTKAPLYICSECDKPEYKQHRYYPNCGAKMDGDGNGC